jgi:hypothetical protein
MTDSLSDMSKIRNSINIVQDEYKCNNCKQYYKKKWCKNEETDCYFCKNFLPMRDTYSSILRDIDWHFLKSGEYNRKLFYSEFLDNLKKWANNFHINPTKEDLNTEKELRKIKNWTREYWH